MRSPVAVVLCVLLAFTPCNLAFAQVPVQPAQASNPAPGNQASSAAQLPPFVYECEGDECTRGGGGAVWLFQGNRGEAMWHYNAVANLTIVKFDGRNVHIRRVDPKGTYSSTFVPDHGEFYADYYGTIHGDRIDGRVYFGGNMTPPGVPWYATIPPSLCDPFNECPLSAGQLMQLGRNSVTAKLLVLARRCFEVAKGQGNVEAEALDGIMLRDGIGGPANPAEALKLLSASARQNNFDGELALSQMYEFGIGVPKNPEQSAFWKSKAHATIQELRAQRTQQQLQQMLIGVLVVGAMADLFSGGSSGAGADGGNGGDWSAAQWQRMQRMNDQGDWASNGGAMGGPPPGWHAGDPMPGDQ
jgi:Sel1 repeat